MADSTPRLALPYLATSQAQKEVTHNEALNRLDAVVQLAVLDRDLTAPPASPVEGDRYIVAAGATGAWAGQDALVASYTAGWQFLVPRAGWLAWVADEEALLRYTGATWTVLLGGGAGTMPAYVTPLVADFTVVNQGDREISDDPGDPALLVPPALQIVEPTPVNAFDACLLVQPAPATPCIVEVAVVIDSYAADWLQAGVLLRQSSSGKYLSCKLCFRSALLRVEAIWMNSPTAINADRSLNVPISGTLVWLRLQDDGTNIDYLASADGRVWRRFFRESRTAFLSSYDQVASRRLATIPGVGPVIASAIVATIGEPRKQAGHMTAPRLVAKNVEFPLLRRGRPHMNTGAPVRGCVKHFARRLTRPPTGSPPPL